MCSGRSSSVWLITSAVNGGTGEAKPSTFTASERRLYLQLIVLFYYMLTALCRGIEQHLLSSVACVQDQDMPHTLCLIDRPQACLSRSHANSLSTQRCTNYFRLHDPIVFWQIGPLETIFYDVKSIANFRNLKVFWYISEISLVADFWWNVSLDESGVGEFPQ